VNKIRSTCEQWSNGCLSQDVISTRQIRIADYMQVMVRSFLIIH